MAGRHPLAEDADDTDDFYAQLSAAAEQADTAADAAAEPLAADGSLRSLRQLYAQGQWMELADATRAGAAAVSPDAQRDSGADVPPLTAAAYHATALSRLQQWPLVAEQLRGLDTDSADAPFALRWLSAELPAWQGDPAAAIASHCRLLDECVRLLPAAPADDIDLSELSGGVSDTAAGDDYEASPPLTDAAAWRRRAAACAGALATHHARAQDWVTALRWMQWLLRQRPDDPRLLSQTGYLMLSMGDIAGAEAMFDRAAGRPQVFLSDRNMFIMSAVPGAHTLEVSKAVLRGNAGLLRFSQQDYSGALEEFEAAAAADHTDAAAVNNAAICQLLSTQAHSAVHELQTAVRERPTQLLTQGCVSTLARLYELGPPAGVATAKQRLAEFAAGAGPQGLQLAGVTV